MATEHKPGEAVPKSGIYRVVHDKNHNQEHEVTAVYGTHFPPCRGCGKGVKYVLVRAAHHITTHELLKV